jgi:hypothetical protein
MPPASVHAAVRSIDTDGDGFVNPEDWMAWMAPAAALDAAAAQARAAASRSGTASPTGSPRVERRQSGGLVIEQSTILELHEVGGENTGGGGTVAPRGGARRGWFGF